MTNNIVLLFLTLVSQLDARLVFIVGTGRSGTNWLGSTIAINPACTGGVERDPEFDLSTRIVIYNETDLWSELLEVLQSRDAEATNAGKQFYVVKCHQLIWRANELQAAFPDSLFVGIDRCVYAVVSSCVEHPGVRAWFKNHRVMNDRFLGRSGSRRLCGSSAACAVCAACVVASGRVRRH